MRKYKTLCFLLISLFFFIFVFFYKKYSDDENVLICDADVKYEVNDKGKKLTLDALYVLSIFKKQHGFLHVSGSVSGENKLSDVDRVFYFDYKKDDKSKIYQIKINREKINNYDNTSSEVFFSNFFPEKPNEIMYIKAQEIGNETYLIKGLTQSFFVCGKNNSN